MSGSPWPWEDGSVAQSKKKASTVVVPAAVPVGASPGHPPVRRVSRAHSSRMRRSGIAKSRWEIENQGFNDAKTRYGLEPIRHHQEPSVLVSCLVLALALTIERLSHLRSLHLGSYPVYSAITLVRLLWLSLGSSKAAYDTS